MRRLRVLAVMALAAASVLTGSAANAATRGMPAVRAWGTAKALPGFASLNKAATPQSYPLASESCPSAGNCLIGGSYSPTGGGSTAFVAAEKNGSWGAPKQIPGLAALGADSRVESVSCRAAGSCAAVGEYVPGPAGQPHAFVAIEKNRVWGKARQIPGLAALNLGNYAHATNVACSPGPSLDCVVAGFYYANSTDTVVQAFVASATRGTWGSAHQLPGLSALNVSGDAGPTSLACPAAGACVITGSYQDASRAFQAFLADQKSGTWQQAEEIPGTAALNTGGNDEGRVACSSAGNCAIGGDYTGSSNVSQAFVLTEKNGSWGTARPVPGLAALAKGGGDSVGSVACALGPAEDCVVAGSYLLQTFVADERSGTWRSAKEIPGIGKLDQGTVADIDGLSCSSPGNCSVVGSYQTPADQSIGQGQAFLATESNWNWGRAEQIPGTAALAKGGDATALAVSCTAHGACGASGVYNTHPDGTGPWRIFVLGKPAQP